MAKIMCWLPVVESLVAVLNRCIYRCKEIGAKENVESAYRLHSKWCWRRSVDELDNARYWRYQTWPITDLFLAGGVVPGGGRRSFTLGAL
jgi:hypothetical protein